MNYLNPFTILPNILLRPSRWHKIVAQIDPELAAEFSLIELTQRHWHNPRMRRLLVSGYLLLPLLVCGASLMAHLLLGRPIDGVVAAFAFAIILGVTLGTIMSAAVGMVVITVVGTSASLLWPDQRVLMFDMITGQRYAHLYGLSSALILIVIANCTRRTSQEPLLRQIGGVVLGLFVSTIVMAGATYFVLSIISARQTANLPGNSVGIVLALLPTLLLGLAAYFQSRRWWQAGSLALLTALLFMLSFGRIGSEYGLEFGGNELLIGMNAVGLSMFFVLTILPYALTRRMVGTWPGAVAAAFGGLAIYIAYESIFSLFNLPYNLLLAAAFVIAGLAFEWIWSAVAYLVEAGWNTLLFRLDSQSQGPIRWLRQHAGFWDEIQRFPFYELGDYLVLAAERGVAGEEGSEKLIRSINRGHQRWAAQAARAELDARRLERLESVVALAETRDDGAAGLLSTPAGLMLRNFAQLGGDVAAALAQPSPYNQRLVLHSVTRDLEHLQSELTRDAANHLAIRYRSVAQQWHNVVSTHIFTLDQATQANQEIPNPYIVGVPLTRRQEIFVGRADVARYVEDILRMGDHPPVLLYGPRRVGKTSLLYQLNWMLPRRILPLVVDLQGPVSLASNNVGFLHALARGIRIAAARSEITLPPLAPADLASEPFTVFDDWLNQVGQAVSEDGRETVLLALDEFEALDASLSAGVLEERAILGMLRHIIQHRRGVKLMLSGSHTLAEFRRWSSYLINAQVVELGNLDEAAARQLIETPIPDFPLRYEPAAVQHVLDLTNGHPYLVQLLCMEVVAHKNHHQQSCRHLATAADVEAAVPATLERGQQFFADIELNQIDETGRQVLGWLAKQGAGYLATADEVPLQPGGQPVEAALARLRQRALVVERGHRFGFAVEVVRRWFVGRCCESDAEVTDTRRVV